MQISARHAAALLEQRNGLSRERARRVLACGLAGAPERWSGHVLYEEDRVRELADRRLLTDAETDAACPRGVLWARRALDVLQPAADQRVALARGWDFSPLTRAALVARAHRTDGRFPVVATVCGFVQLGADLTGVEVRSTGADPSTGHSFVHDLQLVEPGPWFEGLRDHRVPSTPGRAWSVRGFEPYTRASTRTRLPR